MEFAGTGLPVVRSAPGYSSRHPNEGLRCCGGRALWSTPLHDDARWCRRVGALAADLIPADLDTSSDSSAKSHTWDMVDGPGGNRGASSTLPPPRPEVDAGASTLGGDADLGTPISPAGHMKTWERRGSFGMGPFSEFADAMLEEREFFIGRRSGGLLREASKAHPDRGWDEWLRPRVERVLRGNDQGGSFVSSRPMRCAEGPTLTMISRCPVYTETGSHEFSRTATLPRGSTVSRFCPSSWSVHDSYSAVPSTAPSGGVFPPGRTLHTGRGGFVDRAEPGSPQGRRDHVAAAVGPRHGLPSDEGRQGGDAQHGRRRVG